MRPKKHSPRKLLVAAVGVATVNYVAVSCGGMTDRDGTTGNLMAPQGDVYVPPPTSGNLVAPPPEDASVDAPDDGDSGPDDGGDSG